MNKSVLEWWKVSDDPKLEAFVKNSISNQKPSLNRLFLARGQFTVVINIGFADSITVTRHVAAKLAPYTLTPPAQVGSRGNDLVIMYSLGAISDSLYLEIGVLRSDNKTIMENLAQLLDVSLADEWDCRID